MLNLKRIKSKIEMFDLPDKIKFNAICVLNDITYNYLIMLDYSNIISLKDNIVISWVVHDDIVNIVISETHLSITSSLNSYLVTFKINDEWFSSLKTFLESNQIAK